ncbi:MAG: hypothetical protein KDA38_07230, partial [Planctomycetales bacterium]|nr:hypothetical protein [Planctomycetales bacterium]
TKLVNPGGVEVWKHHASGNVSGIDEQVDFYNVTPRQIIREMARTVDDVLARRSRGLLLDASAAIEAAPSVANWLSRELGRDAAWQAEQVRAFTSIAADYSIGNGAS